jgi:hypothetical protein
MLNLVPDDPVKAAGGAIQYLLAMRPEHESVYEFLMRLADMETRHKGEIVSARIEQFENSIIVDKPRRQRRPKLAENETLDWPPIRGQK